MANPQTENGYTRIANEILEELIAYKFPPKAGLPLKLCLFVIRKTYGYHKKMDLISLSQFQEATGEKNRNNLTYWLNFLEKAKILAKIKKPRGKGFLVEYGFNKNHEEWLPLVSVMTLVSVREWNSINSDTRGSINDDTKSSINSDTHKRKKERLKKYTKETTSVSFDSFWNIFPKKVGKKMALKAWNKINPDDKLWTLIQTAIETQKKMEQWTKDKGRFIPHASTWLNQERWEDEVPENKFDTGGKPGKFANVGTKV